MTRSLAAEEQASQAQRIVVEVLRQHARQLPAYADQLQDLALGLHAGTVSLGEAEQVLRIISLVQVDAAPPLPSAVVAPIAAAPVNPQAILGALDVLQPVAPTQSVVEAEPLPTSIEALEQWAGTSSPNLEPLEPEPAAPEVLRAEDEQAAVESAGPAAPQQPLVTAAPDLPSDQAGLSVLDARVRLVQKKEVGDQQLHMVFLDRGAEHGLEKGQRLRVERNKEKVVLLSVFNVRAEMAVAVVLDGTWGANSGNEVRQGDAVVRDR
jgi:hypothetical protein